jgi:predicted transcriptional regulator
MKKNKDIFENGKKGEEDLLDFEFDDLSKEDVEASSGGSTEDEEIIELDDIVETGELVEDAESEEITRVLDEEEITSESEITEVMSDSEASELAQANEEDMSDDFEADLDAEFEKLETSEFDIVEAEEKAQSFEPEVTIRLPDGDESLLKALRAESQSDLGSDELAQALEEEVSEDLEVDLDEEIEELGTSELGAVESVELAEDSESAEIAKLLDGEDTVEENVITDEGTELTSTEFGQPPDGDSSQVVEMQLGAALESLEESEKGESDLELMESDLDSVPDADTIVETELDIESLAASEVFELEPEEAAAVIAPEFSEEDLSKVPEMQEEQLVSGAAAAAIVSSPEGRVEISEEKIETIITKVVQDVVEKVARETFTTVAEKLIAEAIETLKESLESPPD